MTEQFPDILIFAVYFGRLPNYFPLWLQSCAQNRHIRWRVVGDTDLGQYDLPANVSSHRMTLAEFVAHASRRAMVEIHAQRPYKVCDLRPLYWTLIEDEACDFWGHCDLDMLFGDLGAFLTPEILAGHDKVFSVGHLTLYRNTPETNQFFSKPHPDLDYRAILADPEPRGFDEHTGVNRIWLRHRGRFYSDETIIADIDPHIRRLECSSNYVHCRNYRHQAFLFDEGKVKRLYWRRGRLREQDFMYIHFQKRSMSVDDLPAGCERFYITPTGFLPAADIAGKRPGHAVTKAELDRMNGIPGFSPKEIRQRLRRLKRRLLGRSREEETAA